MTPAFSVDPRYLLWLWRYELMCAFAIATLLAAAICWAVRRYSIPEVGAHGREPQDASLRQRALSQQITNTTATTVED
jgi:hypothetical protein